MYYILVMIIFDPLFDFSETHVCSVLPINCSGQQGAVWNKARSRCEYVDRQGNCFGKRGAVERTQTPVRLSTEFSQS